MTVRKEAHRLNVSIHEVRRRRQGYPARPNCSPCQCINHQNERRKEK